MAWVLFFLQIVLAVVFAGSRVIRLTQTTEGALLMEFMSVLAFLIINLSLAVKGNRINKTLAGSQALVIYTLWTFLVGAMIIATITGGYRWSSKDTLTLALNIVGAIVVYLIASSFSLPITDPMIKGWTALVFRVVPQVMLAAAVWNAGGKSLPAIAILVGHCTILMRLLQVYLATKSHGWDRPRKGMFLSEFGNEASWILVTVAWLK